MVSIQREACLLYTSKAHTNMLRVVNVEYFISIDKGVCLGAVYAVLPRQALFIKQIL